MVEEVWKKRKAAPVCMCKDKAGGEPLLGSHVQGYMNVLMVVDCSSASANTVIGRLSVLHKRVLLQCQILSTVLC